MRVFTKLIRQIKVQTVITCLFAVAITMDLIVIYLYVAIYLFYTKRIKLIMDTMTNLMLYLLLGI